MNTPKKHHYVPVSYLKRFTDEKGLLYVFDKSRNEIRRNQKPDNVMVVNKYYHQPWTPASIDKNILEKSLANDLEAKAKKAIDLLIENPVSLTDDDSATLLTYLAFQRIRVPRYAEWAKELDKNTILSLLSANTVNSLQNQGMQLTIKDSARFNYMRWTTGIFQPWFSRMEWEVIKAEDGAAFVTTDSPVSFYNPAFLPPAEAGIGLAGTFVLFPLSSRYLLLMRYPECRTEEPLKILDTPILSDGLISIEHGKVWSHETVTNTNWKLLQLSHHYVVAKSEITLQECGCEIKK
jgi:hypothetical protein